MFDVNKIREEFPILNQEVHKRPLVYLDNGATTQKPRVVTEAILDYYNQRNSNIHRGIHFLSGQATDDYENARVRIKDFINAKKKEEVIFTNGTTSSLNMLAFSFGEQYLSEGDNIIVSEMEHHANIVPWQMLCERKKVELRVIPFNDIGELLLEEYRKLIDDKTKLVSVTHISNVLGTVNPAKEIIDTAHKHDIPVCLDAAQSIQHEKIDVQELDCDFLVFSGHKIYGPTGIGIFYGKEKYLEEMPPWQGGGDMVDEVSFEKTTYNVLPFKFEAGTTNFIGAHGLKKAIDFLDNINIESIKNHEAELLRYATRKIKELGGITIYGEAEKKASTISFLIDGVHMLDTGMILDKLGIAVRTGTHCAQPIMQHYNITGTVRASFAIYNTKEEIDYLCSGLERVKNMFL